MTTDLGPMNELVRPDFGILIPCNLVSKSLYYSSMPNNKACEVVDEAMEAAVAKYLQLLKDPDRPLERMSALARRQFEEDDHRFRRRIGRLFGEIVPRLFTHDSSNATRLVPPPSPMTSERLMTTHALPHKR